MARIKGKQKADHAPKSKDAMRMVAGGISNMNYKDIKRRAIAMGMPFPDAVQADFGKLSSYVLKSTNKPDTSLIDKYDEWVDQQLIDRGYKKGDPLLHYQLRLGYLGEEKEETGERKPKRVKGLPKEKKPKRELDDKGLWKGTKKSYTFGLVDKGYELEHIVKKVLQKFPDANDKSVKQWVRKARKLKSK